MEYNFSEIEKKWQQYWAKNRTYKADNKSAKPKYYVLDMFPYPSGAGLHVGHPLGYIASDIAARYKRLNGFNVLHPMGYDSFGLPAEQYAIQTGQHPEVTTKENIARYREQMDKIGFSFDWDREVRTSDPHYYKWTQWIFIKLFHSWYNKTSDKAESIESLIAVFEKEGNANVNAACDESAKIFTAAEWKSFNEKEKSDLLMKYRIAYHSEAWVNWCPALGTVLANDEVKEGVSERGGYPVERKTMPQWSMRITAYADRLLNGLNEIDWSDSIKEAQRNWIGKSEGTSIQFCVLGAENTAQKTQHTIEVFTTRPDTIFGVTYVTLAPEHELVEKITTAENKKAVDEYVAYAKNRSERERQADVKKITGQFTGAYVEHPFTNEKVPVWVGDYVLAGYGTGAVMAVPAHDSRDHAFAKHFNLALKKVVEPPQNSPFPFGEGWDGAEEAYEYKTGILINSDFLNGTEVKEAIKKAITEIEKRNLGKGKTNFRLRDAAFGRQRYWGEPIPIYYKDGIPYTVEEKDLPVRLPEVDKFLPTETGEPPLARAKDWTYRPSHASPQPSPEERGMDSPGYHTANKKLWGNLKENARDNRKDPTPAEEFLWQKLRDEQLGFKIRRQHAIDQFIVDFVCLPKKLVIEVDGGIHLNAEQQEYDEGRTYMLNHWGYDVIRFTNDEVMNNTEDVVGRIKSKLTNDSFPLGEGRDGASYPLETTTMPGWAGSSWYFLRYMDAHNEKEFASKEAINYWKEIDLYIGGAEHATGHLLYVRFWTKFLKDLGYISIEEPAKKLINQGMIQGVSAFVYGFGAGLKINSIENREMPKLKKYIVPKSSYENYKKDINGDPLINKLIVDRLLEIKKAGFGDVEHSPTLTSCISVHVDISLVDPISNELDVEKFKRSERYNSLLIDDLFCEKDGKYIVGREVEKMSKSKYNVVNPDDIISQHGADCLRLYEMFLGPLEQHKPWNTNGISGVSNFIRKLWRLYHSSDWNNSPLLRRGAGGEAISDEAPTKPELKTLHKTIKKIKEDIERYSFNTSVSNFMICVNELTEFKCNKRAILEPLAIIISPYAPHIAEELWEKLGHKKSITYAKFPEAKEEYLTESSYNYPISFNGKTRFFKEFDLSVSKEDIEKEVMALEDTQKYLAGQSPKKVIVVPKKIVNIVV